MVLVPHIVVITEFLETETQTEKLLSLPESASIQPNKKNSSQGHTALLYMKWKHNSIAFCSETDFHGSESANSMQQMGLVHLRALISDSHESRVVDNISQVRPRTVAR